MSDIHPLITALLATAVALVRLAGMAAVGRTLVRTARPPLSLAIGILVGGAVLGAVNASLLQVATSDVAIGVDLLLSGTALALRWRTLAHDVRELFTPAVHWLRARRTGSGVVFLILAACWINAATPPRDTDSLRYHLAQIQLIDLAGRWTPSAIPHYAIPFAWQTTYLPYVRLALPEAAQLTSLYLVVIAGAAVFAAASARPSTGRVGGWLAAVVALSTGVVTMGSTATADAYTVLVAAVVALLIADGAPDRVSAWLLGFAGWVALGSRYQAAALAIATTAAVLLEAYRARDVWNRLVPFAWGAAAALLLALPFYVANLDAFGNPFWPLLDGRAADPLVRRVGEDFARGWTGERTLAGVGRALAGLVTDRSVFPVPILCAGALAIGWRGDRRTRSLTLWLALFLATWVVAQPMLYPRFVMYALPAALVVLIARASARTPTRARVAKQSFDIAWRLGAIALVAAFALYTAAFTYFPARYLLTGARDELHRFTWYYPVFRWVNENTAEGARFLVVLRSGETYHLNRYHRRADPLHSAEVAWSAVRDGTALAAALDCRGLDYLIAEESDWSPRHPGDVVMDAARSAERTGLLREVARFDLHLTRSRFRRHSLPATVRVYSRTDSGGTVSLSGPCR